MMNGIKIGIVGIGNMGSAHLHCIYNNEIEGMSVTAVCDIDNERLTAIKNTYNNLELFNNYSDMLETDIDAVLIATPHPFHCDMALEALKKGKHVLLEKPIDITVTKAKELNEYSQKTNKVFCIMFNQRTNSLFAKAKQMMDNGELGELKRSVWIITN